MSSCKTNEKIVSIKESNTSKELELMINEEIKAKAQELYTLTDIKYSLSINEYENKMIHSAVLVFSY